jgi:hypothetical protein
MSDASASHSTANPKWTSAIRAASYRSDLRGISLVSASSGDVP